MTEKENKQTREFKLIDSDFNAEEARRVLLDLLSAKINFHSMEKFSNQERFGKDVKNSEKRIIELKREQEKIIKCLEEAKAKQFHLKIRCNIKIGYFKPDY